MPMDGISPYLPLCHMQCNRRLLTKWRRSRKGPLFSTLQGQEGSNSLQPLLSANTLVQRFLVGRGGELHPCSWNFLLYPLILCLVNFEGPLHIVKMSAPWGNCLCAPGWPCCPPPVLVAPGPTLAWQGSHPAHCPAPEDIFPKGRDSDLFPVLTFLGFRKPSLPLAPFHLFHISLTTLLRVPSSSSALRVTLST